MTYLGCDHVGDRSNRSDQPGEDPTLFLEGMSAWHSQLKNQNGRDNSYERATSRTS
jgi:hypothetical protein